MLFKSINKASLYKLQQNYLLHNSCVLFKIFFKDCKNRSTKGTPLQALACAIINWNLHLQSKNNLSASPVFFCMLSKRINKANLYKLQQNYLLHNSCVLFKIFFKNCKKHFHKGYPLAGPCMCNYKLELALAIENNLSASPVFFFSFPLYNLELFVLIVIACFPKALTKQTFTNSKKLPSSKQLCSFENLFQKLQKTGPQRVPPCQILQASQHASETHENPCRTFQTWFHQKPIRIYAELFKHESPNMHQKPTRIYAGLLKHEWPNIHQKPMRIHAELFKHESANMNQKPCTSNQNIRKQHMQTTKQN